MSAGTVIVGGGQAGAQLAFSLREFGYTAPVTVVGSEARAPYQRPPLSKAFLKGAVKADGLPLRADAVYERADIEVVTSQRIVKVLFTEVPPDGAGTGPVGVAYSGNGQEFPFDRLALAVGARVIRLSHPSDLKGVCYLRDLDDARVLKREFEAAEHVVVVGGGFIGLEVAAVARGFGKHVSVVELADRLIGRAVAPVVSEFYRRAHQRRGTHVHLGESVTGILGDGGRARGVQLSSGAVLRADLVVVGVGVRPRVELAEQLGLTCNQGIVVDELARTSDATVVAAGDCTVLPHPRGAGLVRLESVQNAIDQAKCAAATIAGCARPYSAVPWFWSDQDTLKLQIAGLAAGFDQAVVRGDPDTEKFSVLYYRDGVLIAVDAVNRPQDYMAVRRALSAGQSMPADRVGSIDTPLRDLVGLDR